MEEHGGGGGSALSLTEATQAVSLGISLSSCSKGLTSVLQGPFKLHFLDAVSCCLHDFGQVISLFEASVFSSLQQG